jgi:heme-degrading monooxygenase HmoA
MYVVMNRLVCGPSYAEHLERAFQHAGNMQGVPGFSSFQFLRQESDETERRRFVAVTTWQDRESYERWLKSEAFAGAQSGTAGSPVESAVERYEALT